MRDVSGGSIRGSVAREDGRGSAGRGREGLGSGVGAA